MRWGLDGVGWGSQPLPLVVCISRSQEMVAPLAYARGRPQLCEAPRPYPSIPLGAFISIRGAASPASDQTWVSRVRWGEWKWGSGGQARTMFQQLSVQDLNRGLCNLSHNGCVPRLASL